MQQPWSCIRAYCWAGSFGTLWKKTTKKTNIRLRDVALLPRQKQSRQLGSIEIYFPGSDFKTSFLPERRRGSRLHVTAFICFAAVLRVSNPADSLCLLHLQASSKARAHQSDINKTLISANNTGLLPPLPPPPSSSLRRRYEWETGKHDSNKNKTKHGYNCRQANRKKKKKKKKKKERKQGKTSGSILIFMNFSYQLSSAVSIKH